ncbi:cupin domain-containing protein [Acidobacteria bacterium AH-259-O06]|nr:cupin domain-containing protein [Acidobacteria bacterium AH-259-O06]
MPFIDLSKIKPQEIFPGTRIRAPYGEKLMLSYVEIDEGAEVPLHSHPHEQGGVVLKGQMELTIGSGCFQIRSDVVDEMVSSVQKEVDVISS